MLKAAGVLCAAIVPVPSSVQQAQSYVANHGGSINPAFVYIVLIGSNDYV